MPTTLIKTFLRPYFSILSMGLILFLLTPMPAKAAGEIDPDFNAGVFRQPKGSVTVVAAQPDGKVLIAGSGYEIVSGSLRNSLVRVNPDGSVDTTFNPAGQGNIRAIVLQPDGKILITGSVTVRLKEDGSLDSSFLVSGGGSDLRLHADGKIYIAGGTVRRLNPNGTIDPTFNAPAGLTPMEEIAVQPDGGVVGYSFAGAGSDERVLRRLNPDGSLDTSFFNVRVNNIVSSIKAQPDGKIVIGGWFTVVNNVSRRIIARLNADGTLDETFTSPFPLDYFRGRLYEVEILNDGKILAAGAYYSSIGPAAGLLRLINPNGSFESSTESGFQTNNGFYIQLFDVSVHPNGQIVITGEMTHPENSVTGAGPLGAGVSRLNANGGYDYAFQTLLGTPGSIVDIAPLPNGKTVIGGVFGVLNLTSRLPTLKRLNADGTLDTTFVNWAFDSELNSLALAVTPLANNGVFVGGISSSGSMVQMNDPNSQPFNPNLSTSGRVYDIAVQSDGKVIGVGQIATSNGVTRYVMRFNPNGSEDSSFQFPGLSGEVVRKVLVQPDGKILIGGLFSGIGNVARGNIARLNADGTLDTSFNPAGGANNAVRDIALQTDGKLLISGEFSQVNGVSRWGIARLNADGSLDTSFNATAIGSVYTVELQANRKILVGGSFSSIGGAARNRIARLNPNGSVDTTFNVGTGAGGDVYSIELDVNGKVLVGGAFVSYNNTTKLSIVRLLNDIALRVTPFDYDGDGKADISVFRPSTGFWYIARRSDAPSENFDVVQFGMAGDLIVPADYDGDNKTDIAVWRPSDGVWYLMQSSAGFRAAQFGANGDIPVPGDFDGDGKANLAVFRPSTGSWYIARTTGTPSQNFDAVAFGSDGDKPIAGADFDGDGKADIAVFRPSTGDWYRISSTNNQVVAVQFGIAEDKPVAADYDGDGRTDLAVWRPSDGMWYRINSGMNTLAATQFGASQDKLAPADYDGDGKADLAVFRPSEGVWYLLRSTQGFSSAQFGSNEDMPTPGSFVR